MWGAGVEGGPVRGGGERDVAKRLSYGSGEDEVVITNLRLSLKDGQRD